MKKAVDICYKYMVSHVQNCHECTLFCTNFLFSSYIMAQIHEEGNMEDLLEGIH